MTRPTAGLRHVATAAALLGLALSAAPGRAAAQAMQSAPAAPVPNEAGRDTVPPPGVSGRVVDATSGAPIADAIVLLMPMPEGAWSGGADREPSSIAAGRRVRTDAAGRYRFQRLAGGSYRLHVSRMGYTAAAVDLTIQGTAPDVGVGLVVAPVTLTAVRIDARAPRAARPSAGALDEARLEAERARQDAYLSTDVRALTEADVGEAVTLAETDLFRGLHRAPGVSTRDEWSAELWTRGGRTDQTRVTYDGVPLFAPLHLYGAYTSVSPEAVGAAFLHPGVRPASFGEGAAGSLDLRSAPGGDHALGTRGEISLVSARAALDGTAGPLAFSVGARHSYWRGIARPIVYGNGSGGSYDFGDAFARADYSLGGGRTITVSGVTAFDRALPNSYGYYPTTIGRWTTSAARATYALATHGLGVTQTVGVSAHAFHAVRGDQFAFPSPTEFGGDGIQYVGLRGDVAPIARAASAPRWSAGYELSEQRTRFDGASRLSGGVPLPGTGLDSAAAGRVVVAALWAERRWTLASRLLLESGLRVDGARMTGRRTAAFPQPRLALRYDLGPSARLSAAVGRSVQYTQSPPSSTIFDDDRFAPRVLWRAADHDVPPLLSDAITLGAERWLGHGWLAAANGYMRRTSGVATQDPTPEPLTGRPVLAVARGDARGIELSARRLSGRTTASFAYTFAATTLDAASRHYPAPQDRRHEVDFTVSRRIGSSWRLSSAFSGGTGTPYTRTDIFYGDSVTPNSLTVGPPNAERRAPSFLLGVEGEWTHRFDRGQLAAFFQLQSPLATTSSGEHTTHYCQKSDFFTSGCQAYYQRPDQTLFIIPALGLRFAF